MRDLLILIFKDFLLVRLIVTTLYRKDAFLSPEISINVRIKLLKSSSCIGSGAHSRKKLFFYVEITQEGFFLKDISL